MTAARELLAVAVVGHVDHGKSTLIGRLLNDTGALPAARVAAIKAMSASRGMPFEWAFATDAFQAERDQGVTIDAAEIRFRSEHRDFTIIDAPGHREFIKNMVTGAARADAAVLVIDGGAGVQRETRRHAYLLQLLGLEQVCVVVNKMDSLSFKQDAFETVRQSIVAYLASIGINPSFVLPACARDGDQIVEPGERMPWYDGPTLLEALANFRAAGRPERLPLRLPIQDIYKFDQRRIIAGRIESGSLRVGDELLFSPSNKAAQVKSIETWPTSPGIDIASAGQSVGLTLGDDLFLERGEIASHHATPPIETDVFRARVFWLGNDSLVEGGTYLLKLATTATTVVVQSIEEVVDTETLERRSEKGVDRHNAAELILRSKRVLALDEARDIPRTGRFALVHDHRIVGGGTVSMEGYADQRPSRTRRATNVTRVEHRVSTEERSQRAGHHGGVVWLTGLSGAGKSTLALELERKLFERGAQVYVLDGDNIRHGLNADLGFSPEERSENIRRIGEVAALFARAGFIAISAFISPYRSDRDRARAAAGEIPFHEIFVRADLAICEERDPKGLYKKARSGEITDFTGIGAPYEEPEAAELTIDTATNDVSHCVDDLVDYVSCNFALHK